MWVRDLLGDERADHVLRDRPEWEDDSGRHYLTWLSVLAPEDVILWGDITAGKVTLN